MNKINKPSSRHYLRQQPLGLWLLGVLLLIAAFIRVDAHRFAYEHPDEIIAVKVTEHLIDSGNLDSNWQNADLPQGFKYPQYNFSGYLLFATGVLKIVQFFDFDNTLHILRYLSALLGVVAMALTYALGRQWFDKQVAVIAAVTVGINPLLFQDSLYARPETFLSCLTLCLLWLASTTRLAEKPRLFFSAVLLGIAVGTKLSMLAFLPLLFLPLPNSGYQRVESNQLSAFIVQCFVQLRRQWWWVLGAVIIGFVLAIPHVLTNMDAFWQGFQALQKQYTQGQWPHGLADGGLLERLQYALGYFIPTMGLLLWALVLLAGILLLKAKRYRLLAIWGIVITFFMIFATYRTFYERNFSHLLPVFSLFAAYALVAISQAARRWIGKKIGKPIIQALLLIALLFPAARLTLFLYHTVLPGVYKQQADTLRQRLESTYETTTISPGFVGNYQWLSHSIALPYCEKELLEYWSVGDRYTAKLPEKLIDSGFQEVGRIDAPFTDIVPSTLQTYLVHSTRFFYRPLSIKNCTVARQNALLQQQIGKYLSINIIHQDPNWSLASGYDSLKGAFEDSGYYGSWSGNDTYMGKLQWRLDVQGVEQIALPIIAGPNAKRQSVTIIDAETQRVLWQLAGQATQSWKVHRLTVPKGIDAVIVSVEDAGDDWGEWSAIGIPRQAFIVD